MICNSAKKINKFVFQTAENRKIIHRCINRRHVPVADALDTKVSGAA